MMGLEKLVHRDRRPFWEVLAMFGTNFFYFFAPLVIAHYVGWTLRPLYIVTPLDERGPWEFLWEELLNITGRDVFKLFVFGNYPMLNNGLLRQNQKQTTLFRLLLCGCCNVLDRFISLSLVGLLPKAKVLVQIQDSTRDKCSA